MHCMLIRNALRSQYSSTVGRKSYGILSTIVCKADWAHSIPEIVLEFDGFVLTN